jgi:hypothetical protein
MHPPAFLAELFDFPEELEEKPEAGVIDATDGTEMLDAAQLAEAFGVELQCSFRFAADGLEKPLFMIAQYRGGLDSGQSGNHLDGIRGVALVRRVRLGTGCG